MTVSGLVEPAYRSVPPYEKTLGPVVTQLLAEQVGFVPDLEQEMALDAIFAIGPSGRTAAFEVAVVCSRQNLKTALFQMAVMGWLFITDQRLIVWSAHEFRTAQEAFRDLTVMVEGNPWLKKRLKKISSGNGDEAIELVSGQRIIFKARTKGGGRGLTGDKIVLDEAFALQPSHMGALLPTLSAVPDPQVVYGSSAGLAQSDILRAIRDRGRRGGDPTLAYLEWCDDLPGSCLSSQCSHELLAPGCALDDRDRWVRSNPALGRRISFDYVAAERRALPPAEFARERLGWWDDPALAGLVIDLGVWGRLEDASSKPEGQVVFAADVTPQRDFGVIAVAGRRSDGRVHVELVEPPKAGTEWMVGRLLELVGNHDAGPIIIDEASPANTLLPELQASGVPVQPISSRELGQACGAFYDLVCDSGQLRHLGQPELLTALKGAAKRDLVDAWAWSRRVSTANISPLVAATLAVHGLLVYGEGLGPADVNISF